MKIPLMIKIAHAKARRRKESGVKRNVFEREAIRLFDPMTSTENHHVLRFTHYGRSKWQGCLSFLFAVFLVNQHDRNEGCAW
jgi:hypothetical protein